MSDITTTLSTLSKKDLVGLLSQVLAGEVAQAPTLDFAAQADAAIAEAKPKCGRVTSSTGQPCTRNATQEDGACKSHTGDWDNEDALVKFAKAQEFVESRREAAKDGSSRKSNKALAAALRTVGVQPNGEPWAKAKALVKAGATAEAAAKAVAAK